ncbi:MAG TPA: hypothetical protein VIQ24_12115 [Pyrinomonadaceae bacterium]
MTPFSAAAGLPNSYGTLSIQRRFKNTTGAPVTRLRFRVVDITTLNSPAATSPQADMRVITSTVEVRNSAGDLVTPQIMGLMRRTFLRFGQAGYHLCHRIR